MPRGAYSEDYEDYYGGGKYYTAKDANDPNLSPWTRLMKTHYPTFYKNLKARAGRPLGKGEGLKAFADAVRQNPQDFGGIKLGPKKARTPKTRCSALKEDACRNDADCRYVVPTRKNKRFSYVARPYCQANRKGVAPLRGAAQAGGYSFDDFEDYDF